MAAFQHSEQVDDWRELMRLYMVRRTRSFIKEHHAQTDPATGRKCLRLEDGTLLPFPDREPKTLKFKVDDKQADDQYAKLYAQPVVDIVNGLFLPRYGLGNYIAARPHEPPMPAEDRVLKNLSRAGKRLKGFCRTNLFKRLESSGAAFLQSVRRHILRNYVYLHALDKDLPLPIGTQDIVDLDPRTSDKDADAGIAGLLEPEDRDTEERPVADTELLPASEKDFLAAAAKAYDGFRAAGGKRFHWLKSSLFDQTLAADLRKDIEALMKVLARCPAWDAAKDTKLDVLERLISSAHRNDKILVFSQFADTVEYLERELQRRGIQRLAGVTGDADNPTALAWRFSPGSNDKRDKIPPSQELRVLVATDVLSEGQNLQDCHIEVNYDLPWAIIRLIQRAGRVDRIGQKAEKITCYTFLPADGVDRVLRLRQRVRQRLHDNAEVVGTDEAFFDDDRNDQAVRDLFTEKADILNGEDDTEVDLASKAYQIWQNAIKQDPKLEKLIPDLPAVVFSARQHEAKLAGPTGVLVYMRTADDNDALAWIDENGKSVTESQFEVLKAAECAPDCPALPRADNHHELVSKGADLIVSEERQVGGQLGRPSGARYRAYDRLTRYAESVKGTLLDSQPLKLAIQDIYRYPLRQNAVDAVNRILRTGGSDEELAQTVLRLWEEDRLSLVPKEGEEREPHIICSLGLIGKGK